MWVKMDTPKQLWTKSVIEFVSSILGDPICIDDATSKRERLSYHGVSTEGEKGKVQQNPQHRKKQPLKQRWTPKKSTNSQGVTTIDLDPSSSVSVTDGQTHPEENVEHEEGEIADTQLLPEDRTPICTREINRGDGDCEVDAAVGTNDSQNLLISEQSCAPMEQQSRYKA
ncbi:hypothetical protein IFM89_014186 [Coptis chinensis]|uniref:DUF4283 domain-containing protein n=1 Tax=Coptis chinensis TaxID=261450 RepID=A0A835IWH1_9MAGN|nr:hypothetical protein IFM89_014186 [Coptis chinensis]